jgi:hypothetical protein
VVVIVIPSDSLRVSLLPAVRVWYASAAGNRTMKLSHGGAPWPRAETEFSTLFLPWQSRRARPLCRRTHLILPRGGLQPRAPPPRSRRHGPLAPSRPHRVRPLWTAALFIKMRSKSTPRVNLHLNYTQLIHHSIKIISNRILPVRTPPYTKITHTQVPFTIT